MKTTSNGQATATANKFFSVNCHYDMVISVDVEAADEQEAISKARLIGGDIDFKDAECYDQSQCITEEDALTDERKAQLHDFSTWLEEQRKPKSNEVEVLFAVDTEDNVKTALLAVTDRKDSDKTAAIEQALTEMLNPDEWDEPDEVRADIHQAAEQLSCGWDTKALEGYDYEVFWDSVNMA